MSDKKKVKVNVLRPDGTRDSYDGVTEIQVVHGRVHINWRSNDDAPVLIEHRYYHPEQWTSCDVQEP